MRSDNCPISGQPCQSVCAEVCKVRKPLTDEQINALIAAEVTITDQNLHGAVYMAMRALEQAHGITE